jgi:hypothetical protein
MVPGTLYKRDVTNLKKIVLISAQQSPVNAGS